MRPPLGQRQRAASTQPDAGVASTSSTAAQQDVYRQVVDFALTDSDDGRVATGLAASSVTVGFLFESSEHPGPAVLRFTPDPGVVQCITRAQLRVHLTTDAPADEPVAVYPGDPEGLDLAEGDTVMGAATLVDNRPRGTLVFTDGVGQADVTELVTTWLRGGPFPSRNTTVDPTAPLTLVIQPEAATSSETFALFTSESDEAKRPTLVIQHTC